MIIYTENPVEAFSHMVACSTERVQVIAIAPRDDGDGMYDKVVDIAEFTVADLSTKKRKPRAHVGNWFLGLPADVVQWQIHTVHDDEWDY